MKIYPFTVYVDGDTLTRLTDIEGTSEAFLADASWEPELGSSNGHFRLTQVTRRIDE